MSKKDAKNIPILDDIIRTGDTAKAVKGGIKPYPRKLTSRMKDINISADAETSKDTLTEAYELKIKQERSDESSHNTHKVKHT